MLGQWVHKFLEWVQTCWESVRGVFQALMLIRFNIVLGAICSLALYTGQGQDILRALVEVDPWYHNAVPKLCFLIFTVSFALTAWYFARVMFAFTFPTEHEVQASYTYVSLETIKRHVTRWLGPTILFMVSGALIKAARSYEALGETSSMQLIVMAALLGMIGISVLFVVYKGRHWFHLDDLDVGEYQKCTSFRDLPKTPRAWFLAANLASVMAFILFSYQSGIIGPWIGTAGILMLWATTLVAMGGGLVYVGNQYRVPIIGFIIVLVMVFSLFNDNHRVRQIMTMRPYQEQQESWTRMPQAILTAMLEFTKGITSRGFSESDDPFESYFMAWYQDLEQRWRSGRHGLPGHDGPVPIILVSTEGGGIRAAYWTAAVLTELQDRSERLVQAGRIPMDFARHVFSISGVSGGSLGSAIFASMIKEQNQGWVASASATCRLQGGVPLRPTAQTILKQDFLSPTVGVLLFPDMFQRFLPVGILDDRALALEEAWERAWFDCTGSVRFTKPFDELWNDEQFGVPLLFLNGTVVETGQRIIMHPLPFVTPQGTQPSDSTGTSTTSKFQEYFSNALDGPAVLGGMVPLSTAVHMSARFTYVSPAGTIFRQDLAKDVSARPHAEPKVIRVVDGGYFENSGAVTSDEILLAIRKIARKKHLNVHPLVIHISNDPLKQQSRKQEDYAGSRAFLPEILSPVWALLNVRLARGYQARDELGDRAELGIHYDSSDQAPRGSFVHFQLCEYKRRLPLGWMLSELIRKDMDSQLPHNENFPNNMFTPVAQFNTNNLSVVLDGLAGNYHGSGNQTEFLDNYGRDCLGKSPTS